MPRRRKTPWWRIGIRALLVLLVGAGLLHVRQLSHNPADSLRISLPGAFSNPPLPSDAAEDRLLPPVAGPSGDGGYRFSTTQPFGSAPVTYDPCRPIHVVVSYEKAPPNAQESVRAALAAMQASTGLYFILDGETTELATVARPPVDVARYGDRWAPVLIAFTTPARIPRLSGNVAGLGGSTPQSSGGHRTYVTGIVYLDGPDLFDSIGSRWGYAEMQAIIMHELGHVVGLEHTPDNGELMNAANSGQLQFGAGDLRGLARLGQGSCERSF